MFPIVESGWGAQLNALQKIVSSIILYYNYNVNAVWKHSELNYSLDQKRTRVLLLPKYQQGELAAEIKNGTRIWSSKPKKENSQNRGEHSHPHLGPHIVLKGIQRYCVKYQT